MMSTEWRSSALDFCMARVHENLTNLEHFPERTDGDKWICVEPEKHGWWVGGHWVGLIWLAFAYTKDPVLEGAARKWAAQLVTRKSDTTTHDLGFLFELSHILGLRVDGRSILHYSHFACR